MGPRLGNINYSLKRVAALTGISINPVHSFFCVLLPQSLPDSLATSVPEEGCFGQPKYTIFVVYIVSCFFAVLVLLFRFLNAD